jgi:hypothetical protein
MVNGYIIIIQVALNNYRLIEKLDQCYADVTSRQAHSWELNIIEEVGVSKINNLFFSH